MNLIKSRTPVCPDVLISTVFQVLIDGHAPEVLIVLNICPVLVKHWTQVSHVSLLYYISPYAVVSR
jgi:hypothetical protein